MLYRRRTSSSGNSKRKNILQVLAGIEEECCFSVSIHFLTKSRLEDEEEDLEWFGLT